MVYIFSIKDIYPYNILQKRYLKYKDMENFIVNVGKIYYAKASQRKQIY